VAKSKVASFCPALPTAPRRTRADQRAMTKQGATPATWRAWGAPRSRCHRDACGFIEDEPSNRAITHNGFLTRWETDNPRAIGELEAVFGCPCSAGGDAPSCRSVSLCGRVPPTGRIDREREQYQRVFFPQGIG